MSGSAAGGQIAMLKYFLVRNFTERFANQGGKGLRFFTKEFFTWVWKTDRLLCIQQRFVHT